MNIFRKFGFIAIVLVAVMALSACVPGGGGPDEGQVLIGGQPVGAGGEAPAQPAGQPTGGAPAGGAEAQQDAGLLGGIFMMWPILLMFVVMWFLVIRPQRKQAKAARTMQESLGVGDNVMTTSGFFGKIVGVGTDAFLVEFGEGRGFKVWIRKTDIAGIKTPVMTPPPPSDDKKD